MNKYKEVEMKCLDCRNHRHHSPGHWTSVAEGRDDPYDYYYCAKHHWSEMPIQEDEDEDAWDDCRDFMTMDDRY